MKKLINFIACFAMIIHLLPCSASAVSVPILSGDINQDHQLSVTDIILMHQYLHGKIKLSPQQCANADMNHDKTVNIFDLLTLKKTVLGMVSPIERIYQFDVFQSCETVTPGTAFLFTDAQQLSEYLYLILADEAEIQNYLSVYDDAFFAENAVSLQAMFLKEYDNPDDTIAICTDIRGNAMITQVADIFNQSHAYHVTSGMNVLAQLVIPKTEAQQYQNGAFWITSDFLSQQSKTFHSEDDSEILYAVGNDFLFDSETSIWMKNSAHTYQFVMDAGSTDFEKIQVIFNQDTAEISYPVLDTEITKTITIDSSGTVLDKKAEDASGNPADFDSNALIFSSPDGERQIYITQRAFLLGSDVNVYMKDQNGGLRHICSPAADDGNTPFESSGQWSEDADGNAVFSGDNGLFRITWKADSIVIENTIDGYASSKRTYTEISNHGDIIS